MNLPTRAELEAKISHLQKLNEVLKLNTDVSFLLRCNLTDDKTARTVLYELKQGETPFSLPGEFQNFINESLEFYKVQLTYIN